MCLKFDKHSYQRFSAYEDFNLITVCEFCMCRLCELYGRSICVSMGAHKRHKVVPISFVIYFVMDFAHS